MLVMRSKKISNTSVSQPTSMFGSKNHFGANRHNIGQNPSPRPPPLFNSSDVAAEILSVSATADFDLAKKTNTPMILGPQASLFRKFKPPPSPLAAEARLSSFEAPPNVMKVQKDEIYKRMMKDAAGDPAQIQAIEIARRQNLDSAVTAEVNDEFVNSFNNWLVKRGRRQDHINAGWWTTSPNVVPKYLASGGLLSEHPSVKAYVKGIVNARMDFSQKLLEMKLEATTAGTKNWPIEKLYLYYKYVVRGLEPEDEDVIRYSNGLVPMAAPGPLAPASSADPISPRRPPSPPPAYGAPGSTPARPSPLASTAPSIATATSPTGATAPIVPPSAPPAPLDPDDLPPSYEEATASLSPKATTVPPSPATVLNDEMDQISARLHRRIKDFKATLAEVAKLVPKSPSLPSSAESSNVVMKVDPAVQKAAEDKAQHQKEKERAREEGAEVSPDSSSVIYAKENQAITDKNGEHLQTAAIQAEIEARGLKINQPLRHSDDALSITPTLLTDETTIRSSEPAHSLVRTLSEIPPTPTQSLNTTERAQANEEYDQWQRELAATAPSTPIAPASSRDILIGDEQRRTGSGALDPWLRNQELNRTSLDVAASADMKALEQLYKDGNVDAQTQEMFVDSYDHLHYILQEQKELQKELLDQLFPLRRAYYQDQRDLQEENDSAKRTKLSNRINKNQLKLEQMDRELRLLNLTISETEHAAKKAASWSHKFDSVSSPSSSAAQETSPAKRTEIMQEIVANERKLAEMEREKARLISIIRRNDEIIKNASSSLATPAAQTRRAFASPSGHAPVFMDPSLSSPKVVSPETPKTP